MLFTIRRRSQVSFFLVRVGRTSQGFNGSIDFRPFRVHRSWFECMRGKLKMSAAQPQNCSLVVPAQQRMCEILLRFVSSLFEISAHEVVLGE